VLKLQEHTAKMLIADEVAGPGRALAVTERPARSRPSIRPDAQETKNENGGPTSMISTLRRTKLTAPFFEIGPKNLLRRHELEALAGAAGEAGAKYGVSIVLTVPTALIAPIRDLETGVLVFAQGMDPQPMGDSVGRVIAETLVDAGATGVMLNHTSNPLNIEHLTATTERARLNGLDTILCASTEAEAKQFAELNPTAILFEPPELIGKAMTGERAWIAPANDTLRRAAPAVMKMHAGGVASPATARAIMALGADGTGSTSGVLGADDPVRAAREFIAATRAGWDTAHRL
jgi:triosephosphate isomerase (TIM)